MRLTHDVYDLLIIGGGINGAGIAADAAGRGLSVALCEMNDLGSATSSNSSKLIHGGLRYLEYYEFRLVREALAEREVLLKNAPHIIWPLRFRLPHRPHLRPAWMIRAGLFLYDNLAKRATLPASKSLIFGAESVLKSSMPRGFEYSDGWVDDARLVVLNALAARAKGAMIKTRTRCISARRTDQFWSVTLLDTLTGHTEVLKSRSIVNAAGPWVSSLFEDVMNSKPPKNIRLVKGSHIIVPRIHNEPEAYILQNEDGRIVFVIPYEKSFSLIGTTDQEYVGDPARVAIDQGEIDYLIEVTNQHFRRQINAADIVRTYSGVRPLLDDNAGSAQAVTRDYTFEVDAPGNQAPLISIFGGKITTYRKLSEAAVDKLCEHFPDSGPKWTADARLPGGDFETQPALQNELTRRYPWLPNQVITRYVRTYGTLAYRLLKDIDCLSKMGTDFGAGLYEAEVLYLIDHEWALTVEDILWRRTKRGLYTTETDVDRLTIYVNNHLNKMVKAAS